MYVSSFLSTVGEQFLCNQHTDDFALGNKESKLILARICELAQLYAVNLGANIWSDLNSLGLACWEKVFERGIGIFAVVVMLERCPGRVSVQVDKVSVESFLQMHT